MNDNHNEGTRINKIVDSKGEDRKVKQTNNGNGGQETIVHNSKAEPGVQVKDFSHNQIIEADHNTVKHQTATNADNSSCIADNNGDEYSMDIPNAL